MKIFNTWPIVVHSPNFIVTEEDYITAVRTQKSMKLKDRNFNLGILANREDPWKDALKERVLEPPVDPNCALVVVASTCDFYHRWLRVLETNQLEMEKLPVSGRAITENRIIRTGVYVLLTDMKYIYPIRVFQNCSTTFQSITIVYFTAHMVNKCYESWLLSDGVCNLYQYSND